ncbi:MAG: ABC transporter substrate-binding protein, partial [Clostridiales bacterium]|nr:ABC transporter substrate-binding protein [Clostridiales bacterium]
LTARAMLERFTSDSGSNFTNFSDPEYDKIFSEAVACTDDAKQTELYGQLQEILTKDAANLYIQDLCDLVAMRNGIQGYEFYPIYVMDMSKVYFTK